MPDLVFVGLEQSLKLELIGVQITQELMRFFKRYQDAKGYYNKFDEAFQAVLSAYLAELEIINLETDILVIAALLREIDSSIADFYQRWNGALNNDTEMAEVNDKPDIMRAHKVLMTYSKEYLEFSIKFIEKICSQWKIEYNDEHVLHTFMQHFTFYYFVHPPINNDRILRQRGAFLVCPPVKTIYWPIQNVQQPMVATVKADAKSSLLEDFSHLGMTRSYLFPELHELAKDLKQKLPPRKK